MPEPSPADLANEYREGAAAYLWRQWKAIGASVSSPNPARPIVDPEALILMSLWAADYERRLSDMVWSWTLVNSSLISIQRLRNLKNSFPVVVRQRLASLAEARVAAKDPRWNSLNRGSKTELHERGGKVRAAPPRYSTWATLMLQLRQGMGVGAKADALAFVLGLNNSPLEWASAAIISESIGYTPAAVRRVMEDLAAARFVRALDTAESESAPQRMFSPNADAWAILLGVSKNQPGWGYWPERYRFFIEVIGWLDELEKRPIKGYAMDVGAREILVRNGPTLRRDRVVDPIEFAEAEFNFGSLAQVGRAMIQWMANNG
ncbi:MAG: hypothetical protein R2882_11450 [Gemmatimonadales bacterium]